MGLSIMIKKLEDCKNDLETYIEETGIRGCTEDTIQEMEQAIQSLRYAIATED